LKRNDTNTEV